MKLAILILSALALVSCKTAPKKEKQPDAVSFSGIRQSSTALDSDIAGAVLHTRDGREIVLTMEQRAKLIDFKTQLLEELVK